MREFLIRRVSFPRLWGLFVLLVAATAYLFNPDASWNMFFQAGADQAPEFQPALNRDVIFNFLDGLSADERAIYMFYEGVADTAYFLLLGLFALCLLGLAGKHLKASFWSQGWLLAIPVVYLAAELAEGFGLLLTLSLTPSRVEPLLWLADLATLLKMIMVPLVFISGLVAGTWLAISAARGNL